MEFGLEIKDTLRINLENEPPSLDWSISTDTTSSLVLVNIMEGLLAYDLADPEFGLKPALATDYKPSNNAKTWTLKVRTGVKWSDGVEFTGQHVIDGWERILNPKTASEYAYFLFDVKNAKEYNAGKIKDFSQVGIKLNDKGELVIELKEAKAYFPMMLTHHSTYPIRKDVVEKFGDKWTQPGNIVTLGAYKLKIWEHDKALVLERHDDYYGEKAKIKNIYGYMINEFSTAKNLIDAGKIDFQQNLPFKDLPALKQLPGYRSSPSLATYYYGFNTKKPAFKDVKVRKAFIHAVDRKQITDLLAAGHVPLTSWVPTGMLGYEADKGLKFDAALAAKLLDEAGYKDRSKFPRVTIAFNTNENHQRVAENVQAQIKKNLGIEIQISNEEWKVYLKRLQSDTPDIYRLGWQADYPDLSTFMTLMTSFSEQNHTGWGSKKYDQLVEEGNRTLEKEKRLKAYSEAQKILVEDDAPVLPVYSRVSHFLISERVKDIPISPIEQFIFKGASFK